MNDYLKRALRDGSPYIQSHHLDQALNGPEYYRYYAINHPNVTKEQLVRSLNDSSLMNRSRARYRLDIHDYKE